MCDINNDKVCAPPAHAVSFETKLKLLPLPNCLIEHALLLIDPDKGTPGLLHAHVPYRHTSTNNYQMKYLVLASFNARSIYGRESWIMSLIKKYRFAVMGIQDPKLRLNNMPKDLFHTVLYKEDPTPGLRGLMTLIHPAWAHLVSIPDIDDGGCSYIQWVAIKCFSDQVYVANVYLPNHRNAMWKRMANDLVQKLITDISCLGTNAAVVVMGDFNADMVAKKGDNVTLIRRLLSQTQLSRVSRPDPAMVTRKEGGNTSHIDDFLATPNIHQHLVGDIQYAAAATPIPSARHDPVTVTDLGSDTDNDRKPSDHTPIFLHLCQVQHPTYSPN